MISFSFLKMNLEKGNRSEYLPGQHETITRILSLQEGVLEWLLRFRGIPSDVDRLKHGKRKPA